MAVPFTVTRPSTISVSALRREVTPARERIFCNRSSATYSSKGFRISDFGFRVYCALAPTVAAGATVFPKSDIRHPKSSLEVSSRLLTLRLSGRLLKIRDRHTPDLLELLERRQPGQIFQTELNEKFFRRLVKNRLADPVLAS